MAIRIYARRADDPPHRTFRVDAHTLEYINIVPVRDIATEIARAGVNEIITTQDQVFFEDKIGIHIGGPEGWVHMFLTRSEARDLAAKLLIGIKK